MEIVESLPAESVAVIEKIKKRWNWVGIVAAAVVAVVLGPLIWMLAYTMMGVAALGAATVLAGLVGFGGLYLAKVLPMKFANAQIKAVIEEAKANPIPTLWNAHREGEVEIESFNAAITAYDAEIDSVRATANALAKDLKPEDLEAFRLDIETMEKDLELMTQEYQALRALHEKERVEIKRASAIWDVSLAMDKANKANPNRATDTLRRIKKETALDSVTASLNTGKAQMRQRIRSRSTPALGHTPTTAFFTPVETTVKVPR